MSILFFAALAILFHRECLSGLVRHLGRAQEFFAPRAEIRLVAQLPRTARLYLLKTPLVETISLPFFFDPCLYVHETLWNDLSEGEQEALLAWAASSANRSFVVARLLGPFDPRWIDRDVLLLSREPLALTQAIEKMKIYRRNNPPSSWGTLLLGLSILGPSLIPGGPTSEMRIKSIVDQLTRLQK